MRDLLSDALNEPPGRLAEVLINKVPGGDGEELPTDVHSRLERLIDAPGKSGLIARVRLAADLPFLFERAPKWTTARILPLFDWSFPNAGDLWSALKYSNYIGSPELFGLLKQSFLAMFGRNDTPEEDLRTFAEWLATILIAKRADNAGYPLLD
jgi:hypothetical protein